MAIIADPAPAPPDSPAAPEPTKRCTKCPDDVALKPSTEFHVKVKATGRLYSWCKACHSKMTAANSKANPERGAEWSRKRRALHPEAVAATNARSREKHLEKYQARAREHEALPGTKEQRKAYKKANAEAIKVSRAVYKEANRETTREKSRRQYAADPAGVLAKKKAWAEANPEKWAVICARAKHRRRAREAAVPCTLTAEEWAEILRLAGNACVRCRKPFGSKRKPYKDHVVPLSKGGGLTASNVQPLCRKCNNEKYVDDTDYRGLLPGLLD